MKALVLLVAGIALLVAAGASGAGAPYTAKRTAACLNTHKVLTTQDSVKALPPGLKAVAALELGFAMIPAEATDRAELLFAASPQGAKTLAAGWIRYAIEQSSHVQGINQADAARRIRNSVSVQGNVVVSWGVEHPKPASKRLVASCLK